MNLKEELLKENIIIDQEMENKFEKFFLFLVSENEKTNLTRVTLKEDVYYYHFYDSIMCLKAIDKNNNIKLLDIGAGPGFPSVPIKIVRNDIDLTIVEATNKKIEFIKNNLSNLGINNVRLFHSRAEDFDEFNKYDYVTTRAVSTIKEQLPYTIPFLKLDGKLISMKGQARAKEEIEEAKPLLKKIGAKVDSLIEYKVKDRNYVLVVIKKIAPTPKGYPKALHKKKND